MSAARGEALVTGGRWSRLDVGAPVFEPGVFSLPGSASSTGVFLFLLFIGAWRPHLNRDRHSAP